MIKKAKTRTATDSDGDDAADEGGTCERAAALARSSLVDADGDEPVAVSVTLGQTDDGLGAAAS